VIKFRTKFSYALKFILGFSTISPSHILVLFQVGQINGDMASDKRGFGLRSMGIWIQINGDLTTNQWGYGLRSMGI
jgi:hypothetical protein